MKMISTKEYAKARKVSVVAICKEINKGHELPGVLEIVKLSRRNILYVKSDFPNGIPVGRRTEYIRN